jgi:hypothetical protein
MIKKVAAPRASRVNWHLPHTYLVYAPAQPSLISDLSIIVAGTALAAPSTSLSLKPPTLSRRSNLQKLPLVAHLTIHWAYTDVGDDPEGELFAKFREGLNKWLQRQGIVFAYAWARERMSCGQGEVVHCHLLFHLPADYCTTRKLQVEMAIYRLIKKHGRREGDKHGFGYWADEVIKLVIHHKPPYPDGKYLIKGGGPKVWKRFRLRKEHRRLQGIIHGKRCGTTQNIGRGARGDI